jgi:hypothetical protein
MNSSCPICSERVAFVSEPFLSRAPLRYACDRCGRFLISRPALTALRSASAALRSELAREIALKRGATFIGTEALEAARHTVEGKPARSTPAASMVLADALWLATPYGLPTD